MNSFLNDRHCFGAVTMLDVLFLLCLLAFIQLQELAEEDNLIKFLIVVANDEPGN